MNGKVIWTSGRKIPAVFDSLRNNIRREEGYGITKWTLLEELPPDGLLVWRQRRCLAKAAAVSTLRVRDLEERV